MKHIIKRVCLGIGVTIIVLFIALAVLFYCIFMAPHTYKGEYEDMYTVAVNNVFAARGRLSNGEVSYDPDIHVIETDNFGRTLFFYSEYYDDSLNPQTDFGMAFVIMQKSDDGYAYYYKDKCYIPYFDTTSDWDAISNKLDVSIIDQLKELNDWGKELDEGKCARVKIKDKKPKGNLRPEDYEFNGIIYSYEKKNGYEGDDSSFFKYSVYCESDSYGRELYYAYGMTMNTTESGEKAFGYYDYAIILNSDGTCSENGIVKISNIEDSFEIIKELKQNNNWNLEG